MCRETNDNSVTLIYVLASKKSPRMVRSRELGRCDLSQREEAHVSSSDATWRLVASATLAMGTDREQEGSRTKILDVYQFGLDPRFPKSVVKKHTITD